jgi:hypothetical protein
LTKPQDPVGLLAPCTVHIRQKEEETMKIVGLYATIASFIVVSAACASNDGAIAIQETNGNESDPGNSSMLGGWFGSGKQLSLNELQEQFPSVPPETVQRFHTAFANNDSAKQLTAYMEWKKTHVQPSKGDDTSDWKQAVEESFLYYAAGQQQHGNLRGSSSSQGAASPPEQQVVYAPAGVTDLEGHTVVHVLPARMDLGFARSQEVYANSISTFLETKLEGKPAEKVTVIIDARAGRGWANPDITR